MDLVLEELREEVLMLLEPDKGIKARQLRTQILLVDTGKLRRRREAHRFEMLLLRIKKYYCGAKKDASFLDPIIF